MRRATLLVAMVASVLVLVAGVALAASIQGTPGPDIIDGSGVNGSGPGTTNGPDNVSGGGSGDTIFARGGDDRAFGDSGNDDVRGQVGNDEVYGGSEDDTVSGNGGFDEVYGGSGNDTVSGNGDDDDVYGGNGADSLFGGDGEDDFLNSVDDVGGNDSVDGGLGISDKCVIDSGDLAVNCEPTITVP